MTDNHKTDGNEMDNAELAKRIVDWKLKSRPGGVVHTGTEYGMEFVRLMQAISSYDDDAKRNLQILMHEYVSTLPRQKQDRVRRYDLYMLKANRKV